MDINSGDIRVGVVTFTTEAVVEFDLNRFQTTKGVSEAIRSISITGRRRGADSALDLLRTTLFTVKNGDRPEAKNIAVLVTDGNSVVRNFRTVNEAYIARQQGATIYAVGIGLKGTFELDAIVSRPIVEYRFVLNDVDGLEDIKTKLLVSLTCGRLHFV